MIGSSTRKLECLTTRRTDSAETEGYKVSADGLTYTITLRDGLKFHDGAPVKAEDAVASLQRWGKRDGMGQKLMDFTKTMDVVDDKTFTLTLKEPYGLVLDSLGKISSNVPFMMPKRLADTDAFERRRCSPRTSPARRRATSGRRAG